MRVIIKVHVELNVQRFANLQIRKTTITPEEEDLLGSVFG